MRHVGSGLYFKCVIGCRVHGRPCLCSFLVKALLVFFSRKEGADMTRKGEGAPPELHSWQLGTFLSRKHAYLLHFCVFLLNSRIDAVFELFACHGVIADLDEIRSLVFAFHTNF